MREQGTGKREAGRIARPVRAAVLAAAAIAAAAADRRADGDAFEQADRRYQQSFYQLAIESYERAAGEAGADAVEARRRATAGVARCLIEMGRPGDALARLDALGAAPAAIQSAIDADLLTARGAALAAVGAYEEAVSCFRAVLKTDARRVEAAARAGAILVAIGRREEALSVVEPVAGMKAAAWPDDAAGRAWLARAMLIALDLKPGEDAPQRTRTILHRVLQPMYESRHRDRWLARLVGAELLADKHNLIEAGADFDAVLRMNPRAADAHVGRALVAARRGETDAAEAALLKALELNPAHAGALRGLADVRLGQCRAQQALAAADRLLAVNPRDLEALALASAACTQLGRDDAAQSYLERAAAVNPRSAVVEGTLGRALLAMRRLDEAQRRFEAAVEFDPGEARHAIELGDLLMMRGEERAAGEALRKARKLDPYNQRLINLVNLLADIERLATLEIEHFILRYDPREALIPRFVPPVLERAYADATALFDHRPPGKTLIEVFPTHGQFSTRISGRPWVATVGASTGPVIAVVSPAARRPTSYPWADCLRHEFIHTVTLGKSRGRISRWLTEGLAVLHQGSGLEWDECVTAHDLYRTRELASVEEIDARFVGRAAGVQRAYGQARLMADFVTQRWGQPAVNRLIEACATAPNESAALREVLGLDAGEFLVAFDEWLGRQVKEWGFPERRYPGSAALADRVAANAGDADALGMLAETRRVQGEEAEAARLAESALGIDERQPDALRAAVLLPPAGVGPPTQQEEQERVARLVQRADALLEIARDDPAVLAQAADLAVRMQRPNDAVELYQAALARCAHCTPAHAALARMYLAANDAEGAYPHLASWANGDRGSIEPLLRLAELALSAGNAERAEACIRRAIEIDLFNVDLHRRLGAILTARKEPAAAVEALEYAVQTLSKDEAVWADLAANYAALGRRNEAIAAAEKAIALNADSRAQEILQAEQGGVP